MNKIDLTTQDNFTDESTWKERVVSEVIVTNGAHSSGCHSFYIFVEIIRLKGFDERDNDCYIDIRSC